MTHANTDTQKMKSTPVFSKPLPLWDEDDYQVIGDSSLASTRKVRSSAVAPLVAQARGYRAVDQKDDETYTQFLAELFGKATRPKNEVHNIANGADVLYMPHYPLNSVQERTDLSVSGRPREVRRQWRPTNPVVNKDGKKAKYRFEQGSSTPIGAHPSTPRGYFERPRYVFFTEGILKADAMLSAYLIHVGKRHGVTRDDLEAVSEDISPDRALHDLLERIPADERLLIISLAGVHNWRQNSEWTALDFRPSGDYTTEAWVAFDGDLAENRQVWDATRMLMDYLVERKKIAEDEVKILDMSGLVTSKGEKVGVDDFLAEKGTYADLIGTATLDLPPRPPAPDEDRVGQWRMNDSGTILEQCVRFSEDSPARWMPKVHLGARLKSIQTSRAPSDREEKTWRRGDGVEVEDINSQVEIEIAWLQGTEAGLTDVSEDRDEVVKAVITGPAQLMSLPPAEWHKSGAVIPVEVLRHVEWPPRKHADEWVRAMKAHDSDRTIEESRWATMGWVPTDRPNDPVFIIGSQVIDAHGGGSTRAKAGIGEKDLAGATSLAVRPLDPQLDEKTRRDMIRRSLETVLDRFLVNSPWKNPDIGKLMLAASLRPAVPLRPLTTIYLVGQAGSGKALPLDSTIPVPRSKKFPDGLAKVRDIRPGDWVFGSNGKPTRVRAVTDDHVAPLYDVHLEDGRVIRTTDKHVFKVSSASTRDLAGLGASAAASTGRSHLADALLTAARMTRSGQSGRIEDVAQTYGLSASALTRAAEAARVPSMKLISPLSTGDAFEATAYRSEDAVRILGRHVGRTFGIAEATVHASALAAAAGMREEDVRQIMDTGGAQSFTAALLPQKHSEVYPIGELLAALADLLECGVQGRTTRWFSLTARELSARVSERLEIPNIQIDDPVSFGLTYKGAIDDGRRAASGENLTQPLVVSRNPDARERSSYAAGFIRGAQERMAEIGCVATVPDDRDEVILAPDPETRANAVTLLRSVGREPRSSRDGYILFSHGSTRITNVTPVQGEEVESKCLTVDAPDGMFCGPDYVLTHNSWTASTAMLFWQSSPTWTENHLPGSAQDTPAATEHAISISPIWVVDDLAPSPDQRKAAADQAKIGEIIRSVFNNSAKRRSSPDMTQRAHRRPKALLIATAENELSIASAMNRTICVTLPKGSLKTADMSAMLSLRTSPEAPQVTAAFIQHLASKAYLEGPDAGMSITDYWEQKRAEMLATAASLAADRFHVSRSDFERQAHLTADLLLVIPPLRDLALSVGVRPDLVKLLRIDGEGAMGEGISTLSAESHKSTRDASPGLSLIRSLKWLLGGARGAHIANATDPTAPPFTARGDDEGGSDQDTRMKNMALGWSYKAGEPVANGERIGVAFEREGQMIIHFTVSTAFNAAQKAHPELLPPGSTSRSAWQSVWASDLAIEGKHGIGVRRDQPSGKGRGSQSKRNSMAITINGTSISGVPVTFETLMESDSEGLVDDEEQELAEVD